MLEYFKVDIFACFESKCIYPDPCGIKNTNLNVNIQNNYGNSIFHLACLYHYLSIVDLCIKNNGDTGFHLACYCGFFAIAEYCIKDARSNINAQNIYGWTAFHYACFNGNSKLIALFLNSERLVGLRK